MRKRIGNDIRFTWHVNRRNNGALVPESFIGKDVDVELLSPSRRTVEITDVRTAVGVVTFAFPGKNQTEYGAYTAVLYENRGADGMVAIDTVEAVTLVRHSFQEGNEGNDVIEAASVEIESELSANAGSSTEPVQADWQQTDDTAVDYIKNKPDLNMYVPKMDSDGRGNMSIYTQGTITMTLADEQGTVIQGGTFGAGGWSVYSPQGRFQTFGNSIYRGAMGFDHDSVVWEKTATSQIPSATTSSPGLMSAEDKGKLDALPTATKLAQELEGKADSADLAAVATSGSYNDLTDKPTIPAAQVQSDWNETDTTSKTYIKNKPTIPTVPTNVSAFNNDAGYLTSNNASNTYEKKLTFTSLSSTSYTATGNYYYRHTNTVSNLTVTLPSSKSAGDMVVVNFTAGSSPSVSLSGNGTTVKYHGDYAITASKMNEIVCVYNGQYWLVTNTVFG